MNKTVYVPKKGAKLGGTWSSPLATMGAKSSEIATKTPKYERAISDQIVIANTCLVPVFVASYSVYN